MFNRSVVEKRCRTHYWYSPTGEVKGRWRALVVKSDTHKETLGMMLLCFLAGLDGATSHFQRPAAMVTLIPPSVACTIKACNHMQQHPSSCLIVLFWPDNHRPPPPLDLPHGSQPIMFTATFSRQRILEHEQYCKTGQIPHLAQLAATTAT